ncbi:MAG: signal peptidase II [Acidimicrobiaceae bacterium]|nr:signal peptidase II [Acidimicrobiaceae bacterium]
MSNTKSPDSDADQNVDGAPVATAPGGNMRIVVSVGVVVLVLDQITKIWAASALVDRNIDLFWTARFNLTRNFGSAFGLGSGIGRWLGVLILFVIGGVLWYARTITDRRMVVLFGAIAGGAIGNVIDRIFRAEDGFMTGGVIDFIDFQWWPIFNVADIAVVCGATGLMWLSFREPA